MSDPSRIAPHVNYTCIHDPAIVISNGYDGVTCDIQTGMITACVSALWTSVKCVCSRFPTGAVQNADFVKRSDAHRRTNARNTHHIVYCRAAHDAGHPAMPHNCHADTPRPSYGSVATPATTMVFRRINPPRPTQPEPWTSMAPAALAQSLGIIHCRKHSQTGIQTPTAAAGMAVCGSASKEAPTRRRPTRTRAASPTQPMSACPWHRQTH